MDKITPKHQLYTRATLVDILFDAKQQRTMLLMALNLDGQSSDVALRTALQGARHADLMMLFQCVNYAQMVAPAPAPAEVLPRLRAKCLRCMERLTAHEFAMVASAVNVAQDRIWGWFGSAEATAEKLHIVLDYCSALQEEAKQ